MHRLPLADELPYRFHPPRLDRRLVRLTRPYRRHLLRTEHRLAEYDFGGVERLRALLGQGDGVLIAPNHCDRADGLVMLELADRIGTPFCAMMAYQMFAGTAGLRHWLFPRLGIFPVDREGSDLKAFKAGVEVLAGGESPLLLFPEGEVYHLADRLTPIREGAVALAMAAVKRRADAGRTVWIVPVGIKYRFVDGSDPLPALGALMDSLEARFTWWHEPDRPLVERVYRYAEGMLALKELEYLGNAQHGPLRERLTRLRSHILDDLEGRHGVCRKDEPPPVRVKELRRLCLDALAKPDLGEADRRRLRRELNDLFVVMQIFSYPGDYARERPTVERLAEILMKYEEDALGVEYSNPRGPRRAVVRIGEPIDVGAAIRSAPNRRQAAPAITCELEHRIQGLLDEIGPGREMK